jgi:NAD(P)-dependent dehydrogenase (short-subunit alcohol dehydrogenase family)
MNVPGAKVLVVGGARRLGRELALDLAAHGADVAFSYRTAGPEVAGTAAAIAACGRRAAAVQGDLTAADGPRSIVETAVAGLGALDIVVFAASGPFVPQRPEDVTEQQWDASFGAIPRGFFLTARAAHDAFSRATHAGATDSGTPRPQATRGVIVAITDPLAHRPSAAFTAHAAAKAAQVSLVKSLGVAWVTEGIRVCGIAPGPVDLADDPRRAATLREAERMALKRLVRPDEVGQALRFCIENDYVNGANLTLDGGLPPVWAGVVDR